LPPSSPVPGFPLESILAGLVAGAGALFVLRRRRRT
jgi:LPXTG-motif cell wall-anchored protein